MEMNPFLANEEEGTVSRDGSLMTGWSFNERDKARGHQTQVTGGQEGEQCTYYGSQGKGRESPEGHTDRLPGLLVRQHYFPRSPSPRG